LLLGLFTTTLEDETKLRGERRGRGRQGGYGNGGGKEAVAYLTTSERK